MHLHMYLMKGLYIGNFHVLCSRVIMHVLWSKIYHNVHDLVSTYKMNIFWSHT